MRYFNNGADNQTHRYRQTHNYNNNNNNKARGWEDRENRNTEHPSLLYRTVGEHDAFSVHRFSEMHNVCVHKFVQHHALRWVSHKASRWKHWCYQQIGADPNKSMSVCAHYVGNDGVSRGKQFVQLSTPDTRGCDCFFRPGERINRCFSKKNVSVCRRKKSEKGKRSLTCNTYLEVKSTFRGNRWEFVSKMTISLKVLRIL